MKELLKLVYICQTYFKNKSGTVFLRQYIMFACISSCARIYFTSVVAVFKPKLPFSVQTSAIRISVECRLQFTLPMHLTHSQTCLMYDSSALLYHIVITYFMPCITVLFENRNQLYSSDNNQSNQP